MSANDNKSEVEKFNSKANEAARDYANELLHEQDDALGKCIWDFVKGAGWARSHILTEARKKAELQYHSEEQPKKECIWLSDLEELLK